MTDSPTTTIDSNNLSFAWARVVLALAAPGITRLSPLVVSISGFDSEGSASESTPIRTAVDALLLANGKRDSENVAFTIFPQSYWLMSAGDREEFFELYRESFQRIRDYEPVHNKRGSYFQRLVDYEGEGNGFNQLKWILDEYDVRPNTRQSKWQATTFDPRRDLSSAGQLEFPCMQQVSFTFEDNQLVLNAFYATQQILRKGYGNYLGLARLGAFMAGQMRRPLGRLNVFVGAAKLDNEIGKTDPAVTELVKMAREQLANSSTTGA